jgi:hypothetical protein
MDRPLAPFARIFSSAALIWAAAPFPAAQAALLQLTVSGEVTFVSGSLAATFSVGQSMSATFTYESSTLPATSLELTRATYPGALSGGSFSIGSYAGTTAGGGMSTANNDTTFADRVRFQNSGIAAASILTHQPFLFDITLTDSTEAALADLTLPQVLPPLADFTQRSWYLAFSPVALLGVDQTRVEGRLLTASVTPAVPEPEVATLMLLGALGLLLRRRRIGQARGD